VKENHHLTHQTALSVFKTHDVIQQHQRSLKVAFKKAAQIRTAGISAGNVWDLPLCRWASVTGIPKTLSDLATSAAVHQMTPRSPDSLGPQKCCREHRKLKLNWMLTLEILLHTAHSAADRTQFSAAELTTDTWNTAAHSSQCCWQNTVQCSWTDCWHLKYYCTQLTVLLTEHSSVQLNWLLTLEILLHTIHSAADRTHFTVAELTADTWNTAAHNSHYCWQNTVQCSWTDYWHLKYCCTQFTVLLTKHSSL